MDGACISDPCAGKRCTDPPPRFCDNDTLVVWHRTGRCTSDGACTYDPVKIPCTSGCAAGRCNEFSPCNPLTCTDPPPNHCLDDVTLVAYDFPGACDGVGCVYPFTEIICGDKCVDGRCVDDPCAGIRCVSPPAPSCANDTGLTVFDASSGPTGTCEVGICSYEMQTLPCESGTCEDGRCVDAPCFGMDGYCGPLSKPAAYCDGRSAVTFADTGTCIENSVCRYARLEESCTKCALGACN